jgi:peroxiredoxin
MKSRNTIITLVLALCSALYTTTSMAEVKLLPESERVAAPDFVIEKLEGGKTSLADHRGKLVLLHFWATWCMPCRVEMPGLESLWQHYKDEGLVILAVSIDEGSKARVEKYKQIFELSFPILLDPESGVNDLYKVSNMPTSFLIDGEGQIVSYVSGAAEWLTPETMALVEGLLPR